MWRVSLWNLRPYVISSEYCTDIAPQLLCKISSLDRFKRSTKLCTVWSPLPHVARGLGDHPIHCFSPGRPSIVALSSEGHRALPGPDCVPAVSLSQNTCCASSTTTTSPVEHQWHIKLHFHSDLYLPFQNLKFVDFGNFRKFGWLCRSIAERKLSNEHRARSTAQKGVRRVLAYLSSCSSSFSSFFASLIYNNRNCVKK